MTRREFVASTAAATLLGQAKYSSEWFEQECVSGATLLYRIQPDKPELSKWILATSYPALRSPWLDHVSERFPRANQILFPPRGAPAIIWEVPTGDYAVMQLDGTGKTT